MYWRSASLSDNPEYFLITEYLHKENESTVINRLCPPEQWPLLGARICWIFLIIWNLYATSSAHLYYSKTQKLGGSFGSFPGTCFQLIFSSFGLHTNSSSSCVQPMGIAYSLEAKVIISSTTICTLGSPLILCSQKIHSRCCYPGFAVAFGTLMFIHFLSFRLCNNHLHNSTFWFTFLH